MTTKRRKKKKAGPKKIPIRYVDGNEHVEYVPRTSKELKTELERIQLAIRRALRVLSKLRRKRHIVLVTVRFQLRNCLKEIVNDASDEAVADEIARLSYVMEDTVMLLEHLKHSRIPCLEEARFLLTYGQTPKQRET